MKTIDNYVKLVGNLGANPELKETPSGNKLTKFSMATNDYYKNKEGELINDTCWHNIIVWGNAAVRATEILKKGNMVIIEGRIKNRSYEDKEGQKRYITEIVAREFRNMTKQQQVA